MPLVSKHTRCPRVKKNKIRDFRRMAHVKHQRVFESRLLGNNVLVKPVKVNLDVIKKNLKQDIDQQRAYALELEKAKSEVEKGQFHVKCSLCHRELDDVIRDTHKMHFACKGLVEKITVLEYVQSGL